MPLDGAFLYVLKNELNTCVPSTVDKIYQPAKDILIFNLRSKTAASKLFISAKPGKGRINFTDEKTENPETPPMFCMLLRKHLIGGKIIGFFQCGFERVIEIRFLTRNEMGDPVTEKLYIELIGSSTNIIFTDANNRIIDAVRKNGIDSPSRIILPGSIYEPPKSGKLELLESNSEIIADNVFANTSLSLAKSILVTLNGVSPMLSREIAEDICGDSDKLVSQLTLADKINAVNIFNDLKSKCQYSAVPVILYDKSGTAVDFAFYDIKQYGVLYKTQEMSSFSELLDKFYSEKDKSELLSKAQSDILKKLTNTYKKIQKRLSLRLEEIEECSNREHLRICGELIKANIYNIKDGSSSCRVLNYYSENGEYINIELDPSLSASKNSAKYFKEYKKSYTAANALSELTKKDKEELSYLDTVFDELSRATSLSDIKSIKSELYESGFLKSVKNTKKIKNQPETFNTYNYEGYTITVGKNNKQNDLITLKLSDKNDIWLHVKDAPGSHTVISAKNAEVPDSVIIFAANLAAKNSKLSNGTNIPVDYTKIRYVKKPAGSKPGMVIYTKQKTIYV